MDNQSLQLQHQQKHQKGKRPAKKPQLVKKKKRKAIRYCQKPDCWIPHSGKCSNGSKYCLEHREEYKKQVQPDVQPRGPPSCRECGKAPKANKDARRLCGKHIWLHNRNKAMNYRTKKLVEKAVQVLHIEQVMGTSGEREDQCKKFKKMDQADGTYSPGDDPMPKLPNHGFGKIQYYDNTTLQAMTAHEDTKPSSIHCLGEKDFGVPLNQSHAYVENDFIAEIATSNRKLVLEHKELSKELTKVAKRNCEHLKIRDDSDDSAPAFNRAAEVHLGKHTDEIQFFRPHRDKKVFGMVTLYGLEGFSFNFVIVEGTVEGSDNKVEFDEGLGNYEEYAQWKADLGPEDRVDVDLFEAKLKTTEPKKGYQKGYHTIVVYKLNAGQRLIFHAQGLTHGVIIPAVFPQEDKSKPPVKNERSVIVYHDLIPQCGNGDAPGDGPSDANTKATITRSGRKVLPPRRL